MKIVLYTISDFKEKSIDCIKLLLSSMIEDIDYDFYVITNKSNIECEFDTLHDCSTNKYVGYLKYATNLFSKTYDYYIYLDSDILYFDKLSKLLPQKPQEIFSIVKEENTKVKDSDWYNFQYGPEEEMSIIRNLPALNAGSFAFRHDKKDSLFEAYELYHRYANKNIAHDVKLEQSIYNYTIYKNINFDLLNCHDLTTITKLFATNSTQQKEKTLYHFCGFSNKMTDKFTNMKNFYDRYTQ